jgi:hypothetical protein
MLVMREFHGEDAVTQRREDLRVGDVDRAFVAERLKCAVDEGRLSLGEYDERLRDAYLAKTYSDLDRLLGDLPGLAAPPPNGQLNPTGVGTGPSAVAPAVADAGPGYGQHHMGAFGLGFLSGLPRWLAAFWVFWLAVVALNMFIWLVTGADQYFWPVWVGGPWGIALVFLTLFRLTARATERDSVRSAREEMRASRRADRDERRAARYERHAQRYARRVERRRARREL